eukprot:COSAG06_NODE_3272_length_5581_cov_19.995987_4_plen_181_part_00
MLLQCCRRRIDVALAARSSSRQPFHLVDVAGRISQRLMPLLLSSRQPQLPLTHNVGSSGHIGCWKLELALGLKPQWACPVSPAIPTPLWLCASALSGIVQVWTPDTSARCGGTTILVLLIATSISGRQRCISSAPSRRRPLPFVRHRVAINDCIVLPPRAFLSVADVHLGVYRQLACSVI